MRSAGEWRAYRPAWRDASVTRGDLMGASADFPDGIAVRDVVHDVVAEVAPEELPLVRGLAALDDETVVRRLERRDRREPLGFGLGEIAALVTPVVWLVVDEAARRAANAALNGATKGVRAALRKVLRRRHPPRAVPPLTGEQLAEVRRRVLETAAQGDVDGERAALIADAVVARLAAPRADGSPPSLTG